MQRIFGNSDAIRQVGLCVLWPNLKAHTTIVWQARTGVHALKLC